MKLAILIYLIIANSVMSAITVKTCVAWANNESNDALVFTICWALFLTVSLVIIYKLFPRR